MTKTKQIYKCSTCGNIIEVVSMGQGTLSCCGSPMKVLTENTTDGAKEKHVPVIEKIEGGYRVSVGSVEHPMTEAHYIQWIELETKTGVMRKNLAPTDKPVAEFMTNEEAVAAREYCNLHGLWKAFL